MKHSSKQPQHSQKTSANNRSRKNLGVWLMLIVLALPAYSQNQLPSPTPQSTISKGTLAPLYGMDNPERIPSSYIVVMKDGSQSQARLSASSRSTLSTLKGVSLSAQYTMDGFQGFAAKMTDTALERIRKDPNVAYVEADGMGSVDQEPWGLDRIDQHDMPLNSIYRAAKTGRGVNVYVLDSGIRRTHEEFANRNRVKPGIDFVADGRGTNDCDGHGTHVAGTIGGRFVGVADEVTLYPVRVINCEGSGLVSNFIKGVNWISANAQQPAVANASLKSNAPSQAFDDAVRASIRKGITWVVSAGNDNTDACNQSPARVREAITVGASDQVDARASFPTGGASNWGGCVDLFAPGVGIRSAISTSDTSYALFDGTSMAAPHVAGVVAAMITGSGRATQTPRSNQQRVIACSTKGKIYGDTLLFTLINRFGYYRLMARLRRIIVPGIPHHVTQRGNGRQKVFLEEDDYALYRDLLAQHCIANGVAIWSYCLMPNHVHLIVVPSNDKGLSRAIGETHRRYSGYINARLRVTGHLFQGRFGSVAMDEAHLLAAFRYIALNPVKAKLVRDAADWPWSSTPAHLAGRDDVLVTVQPLFDRVDDVAQFLSDKADPVLEQALRTGQSIGRPLMEDARLRALEKQLQRRIRPSPRGRPRRKGDDSGQMQIE